MRTLELPAGKTPREWGQIHGESYRGEIATLATLRTYLCTKVGSFTMVEQVLVAARAHLPVLERYDADLYAELLGIAEGAKVTPEDIVIANHYTDLRDLDPEPASWKPAPIADQVPPHDHAHDHHHGVGHADGCSTLYAESPSGHILAQTWDMHATAIPYVMTLRVPETKRGPAATLMTVTGCLGMTGMNAKRVGIAINNLFSIDATLGVVWPAMVRKALNKSSAAEARDVIAGSPIGSGHHYIVADKRHAYAIEASGTRRKMLDVRGSYCHTNHALDADIVKVSKVPGTSSTFERQQWLEGDVARAPVADLADAWQRLGSEDGWPRSVCTNMATPEAPHGVATCGAIAMNVSTGELWIQQGLIHNVAPEKWQL
jgi:isopenicillin-N N-acyltransferase-like protein